MSFKDKINRYTCQKCRHQVVTVDRADGTTPFMLGCKKEGCDGDMYSEMYGAPQTLTPEYEWVIPTEEEIVEESKGYRKHFHDQQTFDYACSAQREHYKMGGLMLRKIVPPPPQTAGEVPRCGSRDGNPADGVVPLPDLWIVRPDGTRTCSFCGSLHEEDYLDILEHYVAGDEGYRFDWTSKGYKRYANRPGVKNASEGGIKFYTWHMSPENYERANEIEPKARQRLAARMWSN